MLNSAQIVATAMAWLDLSLADAYFFVKSAMLDLALNNQTSWSLPEYRKIIQEVRLMNLERISEEIDF